MSEQNRASEFHRALVAAQRAVKEAQAREAEARRLHREARLARDTAQRRLSALIEEEVEGLPLFDGVEAQAAEASVPAATEPIEASGGPSEAELAQPSMEVARAEAAIDRLRATELVDMGLPLEVIDRLARNEFRTAGELIDYASEYGCDWLSEFQHLTHLEPGDPETVVERLHALFHKYLLPVPEPRLKPVPPRPARKPVQPWQPATAQQDQEATRPYAWELVVARHDGTTVTKAYVGSEKAARRKAMLVPLAKEVLRAEPLTLEQHQRAYGVRRRNY